MFDFFAPGGQFFQPAAVDDVDLLRAQTERGARGVHRHVPAADDGDPLRSQDRGRAALAVGAHQVASRQIFVRRVDAFQRLARDPHKAGKSRARTDKDGFIAHIKESVDRQRLADDDVGLEVDAERAERVDLAAHDGFRKPEFGDPVHQDPARDVQRLVDRDGVAALREVARAGKSRGAGTDDGDLVSVRRGTRGSCRDVFVMPIGDEPFEPTDPDGLALDPADALGFALGLLRADASADGGKRGRGGDDLVRPLEIALPHLFDKGGDADVHGTARDAGHILAVEAAGGFVEGGRLVVAEGDFPEITGADRGVLHRHRVLF